MRRLGWKFIGDSDAQKFDWYDAPNETAWNYMVALHKWVPFWSTEKPGQPASTSEIKRWLQQGAILINKKFPKPDDLMQEQIYQFVLFPKSKKRKTTLV